VTQTRKEHPQKELSKEWIVNALLDLMDKKNFNQITITELSKNADLARRTFYRHFDTVDDVLDYHMKKLSKELATLFAEGIAQNKSFKEYVVIYFSYWEQHKDLLLLLKKNNLLSILLFNFMPSVKENLPDNYSNDPTSDYLFYFIFGGICNLLIKWIGDGTKQSAWEMGEIAETISKHWD